jgi:hypothetical protein
VTPAAGVVDDSIVPPTAEVNSEHAAYSRPTVAFRTRRRADQNRVWRSLVASRSRRTLAAARRPRTAE